MRITGKELRKIIREEMSREMDEGWMGRGMSDSDLENAILDILSAGSLDTRFLHAALRRKGMRIAPGRLVKVLDRMLVADIIVTDPATQFLMPNPEMDADVPETSVSFALRQGHHHRAGLPAPDPEDYF